VPIAEQAAAYFKDGDEDADTTDCAADDGCCGCGAAVAALASGIAVCDICNI
jgi:hypothetical protein